MSGEVIEINYQRTPDDMARLCSKFYFMRKKTSSRFKLSAISNLRGMFIGLLVAYVVLVVMHIFNTGSTLFDSLAVHSAIFGHSYMLVFWGICFLIFVLPSVFKCESCVYRKCKKNFSKGYNPNNPSIFYCEKTLTISGSGIIEESKFGRSHLFWSAISSVEDIDEFLCLFIEKESGFGYIVPGRYFKSEEEKQRIYAQCLKWWEAARENPVAAEGVA